MALERQRLAVGKELTKVQQLQQLIADGAYADDDKGTRAERMALAIEQDRAEATKQAVAAGKEATAQQEREISYSKQLWEAESTRNEKIKDGIRAQMARNAALSEELVTGERVTNARKRALQVQLAQADVTGRSLESEMDIGDEKERQVALLREARQIADQAIREASRKSRRYRGGDARSYDDIAAEQRSAKDAENGDYLTKRMSLVNRPGF